MGRKTESAKKVAILGAAVTIGALIIFANWYFIRSAVQGTCPPCNCPAIPNCDIYSEPPHLPGYIYTN